MMGLLAIIAGLMLLVTIHEFGHWIVARMFGMWTPVFAIGFGPRKFSLILGKFWDTEFRLSPIPLGGYVAIPELGDETNAEEIAKQFGQEPRELRKFAIWKRMCVAVAGVVMNSLFAAVLVFGLYTIKGQPVPHITSTFVAEVMTTNVTIASQAGLQANDVITGVDQVRTIDVFDPTTLQSHLKTQAGKPVVMHITRAGQPMDVTVTPNADGLIGIKIGVTQKITYREMSLGEAATRSVSVTATSLGDIFHALGGMLGLVHTTQNVEPHSIVGIFQVGASAWEAGGLQFITILFSLSLNLAVFNILPVPMLDGGYVLFMTIEKIRGRPLSAETQNKLKSMFLFLLLGLFIWGLVNDFTHPIGK